MITANMPLPAEPPATDILLMRAVAANVTQETTGDAWLVLATFRR